MERKDGKIGECVVPCLSIATLYRSILSNRIVLSRHSACMHPKKLDYMHAAQLHRKGITVINFGLR